jgi:hypothetical protein
MKRLNYQPIGTHFSSMKNLIQINYDKCLYVIKSHLGITINHHLHGLDYVLQRDPVCVQRHKKPEIGLNVVFVLQYNKSCFNLTHMRSQIVGCTYHVLQLGVIRPNRIYKD